MPYPFLHGQKRRFSRHFEKSVAAAITCREQLVKLASKPPSRHAVCMEKVKDTLRATVRLSYDGKVYKTFRGPKAQERFANEVKVLRYLQKKACPFVPILIEEDRENLQIVTTSCGARVQHLDEARAKEL